MDGTKQLDLEQFRTLLQVLEPSKASDGFVQSLFASQAEVDPISGPQLSFVSLVRLATQHGLFTPESQCRLFASYDAADQSQKRGKSDMLESLQPLLSAYPQMKAILAERLRTAGVLNKRWERRLDALEERIHNAQHSPKCILQPIEFN